VEKEFNVSIGGSRFHFSIVSQNGGLTAFIFDALGVVVRAVIIVALLSILIHSVAHAQAEDPPPDPAPAIDEIDRFIAALGLGGAVSVLVQILKKFGIVPDGAGGTAATAINVVVFAVLIGLNTIFGVDLGGDGAQGVFDIIARGAQLIASILASFGTFGTLRANKVAGFRKGET
jgi:hypothetical protein